MNPKVIANVGLGQAIAHFTSLNYSVSIPLTESQRYDMIVDDGVNLYRVEVKTTNTLDSCIDFRTKGGNQTWSGEIKRITTEECDLVFCYSMATKEAYLFPVSVVAGRATMRLFNKYNEYRV